jgi:uncharacterized membrane protein YhaH (DUF805 family)
MNWFVDALKNKYATFTGRARRTEYWMFVLFSIIFAVVAMIIDGIITGGLLGLVYTLGILIPSIAVAVRRLHDTNRSGWWLLLGLVPLLGLVLIYFLVLDSQPGDNEYGPNPKAVPLAAAAAA